MNTRARDSAKPHVNPCYPAQATLAGYYTCAVWAPPRSLAATEGMQGQTKGLSGLSLFLALLRCFSSGGFPSMTYVFSHRYLSITSGGFPHSDIPGSQPVCGSPRLFAAYHVLLRLLVPRHPPCALCSLTYDELRVAQLRLAFCL